MRFSGTPVPVRAAEAAGAGEASWDTRAFYFRSDSAAKSVSVPPMWTRAKPFVRLPLPLIGNRFWPSWALARSLKPKACVSMGAEWQKWARKSNALPPEGWGR